jgi:DNA-binding Lrp family transcriptional regulator
MGRAKGRAEVAGKGLPKLDDRVRDLLSEFPGAVAFAGIRRTLGVHPESLSRALRRLEREGSVERTEKGYRLTAALPKRSRAPPANPEFPRWHSPPLVELRLSPGEDATKILGLVAGRWFGEFRWVGSYEEGRRVTMLWVSRLRKNLLGLVLEGDILRIHFRGRAVRKVQNQPLVAYQLLQHILKAMGKSMRAEQSAAQSLDMGPGDFTPTGFAG